MSYIEKHAFTQEIDRICGLNWGGLSEAEFIDVAWAYYYFSVQFRENLEIALGLHPDDPKLQQLHREECDTANLSPFPGVAAAGERMNHDEFMLRTLHLAPLDEAKRLAFEAHGAAYLAATRAADDMTCALSIASYEDGGLEAVFRAILQGPQSDHPAVAAFRHFLSEHIRFDSDPDGGHGALSRHLVPDDRILPLWKAFRDLLTGCVPGLA